MDTADGALISVGFVGEFATSSKALERIKYAPIAMKVTEAIFWSTSSFSLVASILPAKTAKSAIALIAAIEPKSTHDWQLDWTAREAIAS